MDPNRYDAVIGIHTVQRRFLQQNEISNFPRLDGSELRIKLEFPCVTDRSGSENLCQRHSRLLKLFFYDRHVGVDVGLIDLHAAGGLIAAITVLDTVLGQYALGDLERLVCLLLWVCVRPFLDLFRRDCRQKLGRRVLDFVAHSFLHQA